MKRNPRLVAIQLEDGTVNVHASGENAPGGYAALCGLAGDGTAHGGIDVGTSVGAKIDCPQCHRLFMAWSDYRADDFARKKKTP